MHVGNILKLSYWFAINTPSFSNGSLIVMTVVLVGICAIAIVLRVFARQYASNPLIAKGLYRVTKPFLFTAILGGVFVAFRQLGAAVLSMRFFIFLTIVIGIAWFAGSFHAVRKKYVGEYARLEQSKKYREYLPKRRK